MRIACALLPNESRVVWVSRAPGSVEEFPIWLVHSQVSEHHRHHNFLEELIKDSTVRLIRISPYLKFTAYLEFHRETALEKHLCVSALDELSDAPREKADRAGTRIS